MTLIRLVQRASILSSLVVSSLLLHSNPARSEQRVCIITDDGATMCGKPTSSKKEAKNPKQQNSGYRKEVNNFVYLLKGCRKSDTSVKCEFTITNKGVEKNFDMGNSYTTIIDSNGKSYPASSVDIGGVSDFVRSLDIAPGIDYEAAITFPNIPEKITKVPLLNLYSSGQKIQFRNVSFSD
jgi:hypothetical protein